MKGRKKKGRRKEGRNKRKKERRKEGRMKWRENEGEIKRKEPTVDYYGDFRYTQIYQKLDCTL